MGMIDCYINLMCLVEWPLEIKKILSVIVVPWLGATSQQGYVNYVRKKTMCNIKKSDCIKY